MKLQYTTNCALLIMAYLTGENRIIPSRELQEHTGFAQQSIFTAARKLKAAGYVTTVSGPFGGYILGKPADRITVQEILELFCDTVSIRGGELSERQADKTTLRNFANRLAELDADLDRKLSALTFAELMGDVCA